MKKHIILLLKTLINNNACVEAARTREKKYNIIGPIFAVFALFFCALPVCVKGFQTNGQDVVSTSYGVDDGLYAFGSKLTQEKESTHKNFIDKMVVTEQNGKHVLKMDNETWKGSGTTFECYDTIYNGTTPTHGKLENLYRFTYTAPLKPGGDYTNWLEIYFTEKTGSEFQTYYANIASNKNPEKADQAMSVVRDATNPEKITSTNTTRNTSFIVFGKEDFVIVVYSKSTSTYTMRIGDYQNTAVGTNLFTKNYDSKDNVTTLNNWKVFFNEAYINYRFHSTWKSTGINLGINGGVLILMGFVIWITTRGKNNPFRIYSYWDSQKICFYASLTPGIIGLLGFMSVSLSTMLFAMSCGVRVLWLSMRTLKYTAPAK